MPALPPLPPLKSLKGSPPSWPKGAVTSDTAVAWPPTAALRRVDVVVFFFLAAAAVEDFLLEAADLGVALVFLFLACMACTPSLAAIRARGMASLPRSSMKPPPLEGLVRERDMPPPPILVGLVAVELPPLILEGLVPVELPPLILEGLVPVELPPAMPRDFLMLDNVEDIREVGCLCCL